MMQPIKKTFIRSINTTVRNELKQNFNKQQAIEPTRFTSFAQYRLAASQHDPLLMLERSRHPQHSPITKIEIKDDYYSFNNKFREIARAIEYREEYKKGN